MVQWYWLTRSPKGISFGESWPIKKSCARLSKELFNRFRLRKQNALYLSFLDYGCIIVRAWGLREERSHAHARAMRLWCLLRRVLGRYLWVCRYPSRAAKSVVLGDRRHIDGRDRLCQPCSCQATGDECVPWLFEWLLEWRGSGGRALADGALFLESQSYPTVPHRRVGPTREEHRNLPPLAAEAAHATYNERVLLCGPRRAAVRTPHDARLDARAAYILQQWGAGSDG